MDYQTISSLLGRLQCFDLYGLNTLNGPRPKGLISSKGDQPVGRHHIIVYSTDSIVGGFKYVSFAIPKEWADWADLLLKRAARYVQCC